VILAMRYPTTELSTASTVGEILKKRGLVGNMKSGVRRNSRSSVSAFGRPSRAEGPQGVTHGAGLKCHLLSGCAAEDRERFLGE